MGTPYFKFKKFTIWHDKCAMKVGTDGVLLGAWAEVGNNKGLALDIGTGSGLIAVMMAQRNQELSIHAIDIDVEATEQARYNADLSPYSDRITIECTDLTNYFDEINKYDIIVSNPPFYEERTYSGNNKRDKARHTSSLPFSLLLEKTSHLMKDKGSLSVIIPYSAVTTFILAAAEYGLYLNKRTDVYNSPSKQPKRSLLCFRKTYSDTIISRLDIRNDDGSYSEEYTKLTEDFYL